MTEIILTVILKNIIVHFNGFYDIARREPKYLVFTFDDQYPEWFKGWNLIVSNDISSSEI